MRDSLFTYHNWPVKRKLSAVVLLISGLLIGCMVFAITIEKHYSYRSMLVKNSMVLAQVTSANSTAALTFGDADTAYEILSALKAEQGILAAAIFNLSGKMFVTYSKNDYQVDAGSPITATFPLEEADHVTPTEFVKEFFDISYPIKLEKKTIGQIVLRTDLRPLNSQIRAFTTVIAVISFLLIAMGMMICSRLISAITEPVTQLADIMRDIPKTMHLSMQMEKKNNDEIGVLIDGFNDMVHQIQKRDEKITENQNILEELVDTRTHELKLANEQLVIEIEERQEAKAKLAHAQKMEAIGTLAGGVAHDLNNILSGIVSYPDLLLLELPQDSKLKRPIETIRSSGKKAAAIVQDLLTLARRGARVKEQIDIQQLVVEYLNSPECAELLRINPGVEIEFSQVEKPFLVNGSPVHLSKTIMNLVSNGAEAIEGSGQVTIHLKHVTLDSQPVDFHKWRKGQYVRLAIQDNGIGINKKYIERIFEPFYSRKVMGRSGTGLGMAVVWGTVEDHDGYITVASEEGVGTLFHLYFPSGETPLPKLAHLKKEESQPRGSDQTILVVDDSEEQRQIAVDVLTHLGYRATSVASGEAAVAYVRKNSVELLVLDMLMAPGIDGLETYKRILEFRPNQKAVIASGYSKVDPIREARELGVTDYILKPYTVQRIGQVVHDALKKENLT